MPAPQEAVLIVLREWLVKAENDLTAASQIMKLGKAAPMDTICFHAQQCQIIGSWSSTCGSWRSDH